jgi:hypothetical protein
MPVFAIVVLLVSGLSLLAFGVAITWAPLPLLAMAGVDAAGAAAEIELRAFYGGLEIALAAIVLYCLRQPARRRDGLALTAIVYGGIGLARAGGMIAAGYSSSFLAGALAFELGIAAAALVALRRTR